MGQAGSEDGSGKLKVKLGWEQPPSALPPAPPISGSRRRAAPATTLRPIRSTRFHANFAFTSRHRTVGVPVVAETSESVPHELAHWIKLNAKDLKIRQNDRCWAAEVVNDFRENLLKFLRSEQPLFQSADFLTTGSYFEKVKIHSPDEFDMMLKVQLPCGLNMTKLDGGLYYRIDLVRPTRCPIQAFLLENKLTVLSSKVLSEMHGLVRKFLKTYRAPDHHCHWEVNRKRLHSPAVTLSLRRTESSNELISVDVVFALEVQRWPPAVRNGPDVDNWLGKKVRQEIKSLPCFFVPKRLKGQKGSEDAKESWRISFSHIEKKIIMFHGNKKTCCESKATKCCRKQCLMLLKSLIEGLKHHFPKELDGLCSYHGKTVFLHSLSSRFDDSVWEPRKLPACFLHLIGVLENHARTGILPHFFVPECNLFSSPSFSRKSLAFLVNVLEEQRREGLPLLKPPAPVSPLRPTMTAAKTATGTPTEDPLASLHPVTLILMLLVVLLVFLGLIGLFK
ncbi:cyclic GMP-AMP synthase [Xenentodon cancila]